MGREVRAVPANWQHPAEGTYSDGSVRYVPKFGESYADALAEWEAGEQKWERPDPESYMPNWPASERTHLMMYETCSEGTPISPAFATPEELARWLADNNASAFGSQTATYEQWLATIKRGWSVSAIIENGVIKSGVEAQ